MFEATVDGVAGHQFVAQWNVVKGECCEEVKEQVMDLVDSYVKAVAKALPEAQREDIIGELSKTFARKWKTNKKSWGGR